MSTPLMPPGPSRSSHLLPSQSLSQPVSQAPPCRSAPAATALPPPFSPRLGCRDRCRSLLLPGPLPAAAASLWLACDAHAFMTLLFRELLLVM